MSLVERAQAYFGYVRACEPAGVAGMFAEDGVLNLPNGETVTGRAAIEAYYARVFSRATPNPTVLAIAADGDKCLVELLAHGTDGSVAPVADVFTFNKTDQVAALSIYLRHA